MRVKRTAPTWVSLVTQALSERDTDFLSLRMLCERTGGSYNQVHAALCMLRKYHAVDVVIETDGTGWWFLLPTDDRVRTVQERTPETKPRRKRAKRVTITKVAK